MEPRNRTREPRREAMLVNRNLAIEVTLDEILDDLLYPVREPRPARLAKQNGRAR